MSSIIPLVSDSRTPAQQHTRKVGIYSKFVLNYLNTKFLSNFINILIYQTDLSLVTSSSTNSLEIYKVLKRFNFSLLNDLNTYDDLNIPKKHYNVFIQLISKVIELKEDSTFSLITYDNFLEHFRPNDQFVLNVINANVLNDPIKSYYAFQSIFDSLLNEIQVYDQMQLIKSTISKWENFLTESDLEVSDLSAYNWVKRFKDTISEANTNLSNINAFKQNNAPDYLMFYDKPSISEALNNILNYLKVSYEVFKTGYSIIDDNLSGIESSSVMIIAGPSNHAKSILMLNIMKAMLQNNDQSSEDEVYILITLEDDINKLFRRIISIFGNYDAAIIKKVYLKVSEILKSTETSNMFGQDAVDKVTKIMEDITNDSILSVTHGKKRLVIKHSSENTFSMADACRFIDSFEIQNLKVKGMFIDYIDVMIPNSNNKNDKFFGDEYTAQGQIVQEMRLTARKYSIPILSITQNNRTAENFAVELNNGLIGDSARKIRYSDTILMIRQREDLDIFNEHVSSHINADNAMSFTNTSNDYLEYAIPFEAKITKAKDGDKSSARFHIFNKKNLRINQTVAEYIKDIDECVEKSTALLNKLSVIGLTEADLKQDLIFDEDNPFDNLII